MRRARAFSCRVRAPTPSLPQQWVHTNLLLCALVGLPGPPSRVACLGFAAASPSPRLLERARQRACTAAAAGSMPAPQPTPARVQLDNSTAVGEARLRTRRASGNFHCRQPPHLVAHCGRLLKALAHSCLRISDKALSLVPPVCPSWAIAQVTSERI